ncbi:MAG: c-type cytochrome [Candidatus Binataceae bacterium]
MVRTKVAFLTAASAVAVIAGFATLPHALNAQQSTAHHQAPATKNGNVVMMLCDGKTSTEIKGLKPGQRMSRDQAKAVSRQLMQTWQREHPGERWEMAQVQSPGPASPPSESSPESSTAPGQTAAQQVQGVPMVKQALPQQQGDTYASFHERDFKIWQAETQKFVEYGKQIFHSDKLLGGTIGVSCDMCHPDASNTHPETYPKYQVQLQRVALLRDMINWCIENPVKGKTMDPNDERLRALEAYILEQRKGVALAYGKH